MVRENLLTSEEINKQLDLALAEPKQPTISERFSYILLFFVVGAILGLVLSDSTKPPKEVIPLKEANWRYESQPYSQEADGSVVYYHGYTQGVTDNPISDKPYSVSTDGKVIFYHGK